MKESLLEETTNWRVQMELLWEFIMMGMVSNLKLLHRIITDLFNDFHLTERSYSTTTINKNDYNFVIIIWMNIILQKQK